MKSKLNKTVTLYTLLMLIVFPLFMVHTYYDIQTVKMYFYQFTTLACAGIVALIALLYLAGDKEARCAFTEGIRLRNLKKSLRAEDICALIFLIVVVLSTLCSEWVYEAFWGNTARYQGGYMLSLMVVSFFLITRYYVPRRIHFDLMLLSGIIMCAWGVLDYFSLSPIGFSYKTLFSSTIGNIDVLTSIEVMYVGVASIMYIAEQPRDKSSRRRSLYYLIAAFICFMGLECGRTANLLLSFTFLICFMPFYAFGSARGTLRYIELLMAFTLAMLVVAGLVAAFPDYACAPDYMGELDKIANTHPGLVFAAFLFFAALRAVAGFAIGRYMSACKAAATDGAGNANDALSAGKINDGSAKAAQGKPAKQKTAKAEAQKAALEQYAQQAAERKIAKYLRMAWGALGIAAFCGLIYVLYDANTGGHPELYAPISNLVIFDLSWGTDRGYVWALALKYFREFPFIKQLIGSGPETFAIYVLKYDLNATLSIFDVSYDSIHNEWLQHLFECGIIGCIGFYGMVIAGCVRGLKAGRCTAALSFAVMAYFVQSFVNISVPIVLPFVIVCIAVAAGKHTFEYDKT